MLSVFQKQPKPDPNTVETAPPPPQPPMAESDSAAPTSPPPSTDVVLATATNEPVQEHDDNTPAPPEPVRLFPFPQRHLLHSLFYLRDSARMSTTASYILPWPKESKLIHNCLKCPYT